eukprot:2299568-Rhodomonas_salina.2
MQCPYAPMRVLCDVRIGLCACYEVSGTEVAYGGTAGTVTGLVGGSGAPLSAYARAMRSPVLR